MNHLNAVVSGITDNYHIHFIITENMGYVRELVEPGMLGQSMPSNSGITMGDDVRGQRFFDSDLKFTSSCEKYQGYVIRNGKVQHGKVIISEEEAE